MNLDKNTASDTPLTSYQIEKEKIMSEIGDLESVRNQLGLSRRKICQLLLVDPSSWTRWVNGETQAPAYIYRSLQWCLAIMDKYPQEKSLSFSLSHQKNSKIEAQNKILEERVILQRSKLFELQQDLESLKKQNLKSNQMYKNLWGVYLGLYIFGIFIVLYFN